ncbi:HD domain-containing protein [Nitrosomonas sp. Is24]|uniref:HD domain-containing protein n=1 Tax=Nitrosomonas sp. Is24 TaxID=3080533 RepID=UPI00294B61A7|nr:HD domain-containing protein [Nitrosomonas sp. Is24]MDV6341111.1 HD domain-containing protein [Nitrosomonas sp. Is24]
MSKKTTDMALILKALEFASIKHRDQRRKDASASPYINHPITLAKILCVEGGIADTKVICAALLHDTIEDTETTAEELQVHFGKAITKIVLEVTDDKKLPKAERKRLQIENASHASKRAKLVKLADKISNLRDILNSPPADWSIKRKQEYFDWAKEVVDQVKDANKKLGKAFDQVYTQRP